MRFVVRSVACVDGGSGLSPAGRRSVRVEAIVKGKRMRGRIVERGRRWCMVRG